MSKQYPIVVSTGPTIKRRITKFTPEEWKHLDNFCSGASSYLPDSVSKLVAQVLNDSEVRYLSREEAIEELAKDLWEDHNISDESFGKAIETRMQEPR